MTDRTLDAAVILTAAILVLAWAVCAVLDRPSAEELLRRYEVEQTYERLEAGSLPPGALDYSGHRPRR